MWTLKSSWLAWMDHLESIGGECDGPDFCRKFGDITIAEGIEKCPIEQGFHYAWAVWVFQHTTPETTSVAVRHELLRLIVSPADDCSIARAKHIYKDQALLKHEKQLVLKTVFRNGKIRYGDFSATEIREGRSLNG